MRRRRRRRRRKRRTEEEIMQIKVKEPATCSRDILD